MGDFRIPTVLAVGLWSASALAVLTYTYIAFSETATDLEKLGMAAEGGLIGSAAVLAAEGVGAPEKKLERGKFNPSQMKTIPGYGITPKELGY